MVGLTQTLTQVRRTPQCSVLVAKRLDNAGPLLWVAAVGGQVFAEVKIDVTKPGDKQPVFYQIKLLNARVTGISTSASASSDDLREVVTLGADTVELHFFPQRPDGGPGTPVTSSFAC